MTAISRLRFPSATCLRTSISRAVRLSPPMCSAIWGCNFEGNTLFTGVDLADDFDEFSGRHALEHVGASSSGHRLLDFDVSAEGGEDDDASVWIVGANSRHRLDSAHVGKTEIHQSDVGMVPAKGVDRLAAA